MLHDEMIVMCLHVLQLFVLQSLVNCSHINCEGADIGNNVHKLLLVLRLMYVQCLQYVVLVTSALV